MELSEFIAEIKTSMKSYDSANLIDDISIQNWVIDEMKRFGANIMELQEKVLVVKNGQTKLPDNYWHLRLAVKVKAERYNNLDGDDEDVRYSRELYDRIERGAKWSPEGECIEISEKTITEKVFINNNRVELHYCQPELLKVIRGVIRKKGSLDCINLSHKMAKNAPNTIVINNRTLQTNFADGIVYIQYYGFLSDEEGNIIIPETQHNRLKTYLEYHVKSKILEDLWANNDDVNVGNKLAYFKQEARNQFTLAMTEAKFSSLNWKSTRESLRRENRRKMQSYENLFPSI